MSDAGAISFLEMRTDVAVGSVRVLNDLLAVTLSALGARDSLRHDLALGLAELVTNVCEHEHATSDLASVAGGTSGDGVTVTLDARDGDLLLTVSSSGPHFDLDAAIERAQNRDPLAELDGNGLGLPLLLGLFDAVSNDYREGVGNRISLRKQRWREEGQPAS